MTKLWYTGPIIVPEPTGVCGTVPPIVGMGLNLVRLNPMSIRSSIFQSLEWESLSFMNSLCTICIALAATSVSQQADCKINLIISFSSSSHVGTYLGDDTWGRPLHIWDTWSICSTMSIFLNIFSKYDACSACLGLCSTADSGWLYICVEYIWKDSTRSLITSTQWKYKFVHCSELNTCPSWTLSLVHEMVIVIWVGSTIVELEHLVLSISCPHPTWNHPCLCGSLQPYTHWILILWD